MVYYIGMLGRDGSLVAVKIGWTGGRPMVRLRGLQAGQPLKLVLLAAEEGTDRLERQRHLQFSALRCRARCEWFWPEGELMRHIESLVW